MLRTLCVYQFVERTWLLTVLIFLSLVAIANAQNKSSRYNVTIPNTSSQIVYTPSICNASTAITDAPSCNGAWQILDLNGTTVISTNGPDPERGSIIPQMFFQFRACAMYIFPSSLSNATANITVSTNQASVSANFNSSIGVIAILNLLQSDTTTVTLTFVPSSSPSRLDINALILTVPANATATSIILPTVTLPPSMTLSFPAQNSTSASTSTPSHAPSNHTLVAEAVGIVIGLSFGLTAVTVVGYICWRRRRLKNSDISPRRGVGHEKHEVRS